MTATSAQMRDGGDRGGDRGGDGDSSDRSSSSTTARAMRSFWHKFPEKEALNQYWYSSSTVETLAAEVVAQTPVAGRCAFLSTPSVYFAVKAMKEQAPRELFLFDLDDKFASEGAQFVSFDFNQPHELPVSSLQSFDYIVVDPPFITKDVWQRYAVACRRLLHPTRGKLLLSTIPENEQLLHDLLGCERQSFRPSIPHLVYQYALFANYDSMLLRRSNPEVEADEGA